MMAQNQKQNQRGQQGIKVAKVASTKVAYKGGQGGQQGGARRTEQQNQDPNRRGGLRNNQQDDPRHNQRSLFFKRPRSPNAG